MLPWLEPQGDAACPLTCSSLAGVRLTEEPLSTEEPNEKTVSGLCPRLARCHLLTMLEIIALFCNANRKDASSPHACAF